MLLLSLLMPHAEAIVVMPPPLVCDVEIVVTSVGGCLQSQPVFTVSSLEVSATGSVVEQLEYNRINASLEDPGWIDAAHWRQSGTESFWATAAALPHAANSTEDFFAFAFTVSSGEDRYVAGISKVKVGSHILNVDSDEAVLLTCDTDNTITPEIVALPAALE